MNFFQGIVHWRFCCAS